MKIYLHLKTEQLCALVEDPLVDRGTQQPITRQPLIAVAIKVASKQTKLQQLIPLLTQKIVRKYSFPKDFDLSSAGHVAFRSPQNEPLQDSGKVSEATTDKGGMGNVTLDRFGRIFGKITVDQMHARRCLC